MNINKITARLKSEACRNHIKKQYETDKQTLGEREALEFAIFRTNAPAAEEAETDNHIKDAVSSGRLSTAVYAIVYTAILFFAIGFISGRLL